MQLNNSDCLSIVALAVSIASAYYSKKQRDLSEIALHNTYRAQLTDNHNKYRIALKQVNDKHKNEISLLSQKAGNALTTIVDMFDLYDNKQHKIPYLRHLIHECSEMVYYAFNGQLGWQTGRISHRFFQMTHLEDRLEPRRYYFTQDECSRIFESQYFKDPNKFQETELMHDIHFCSLVNQIKERIDFSRKAELLLNIQMNLKTFNTLFKDLKPKIAESASYLKEILEESDLEHFKLLESPELCERLIDTKAKLDTLSKLQIQEIDREYADKYYNYVSLSIHTCAILHAIEGFQSWGWQYGK